MPDIKVLVPVFAGLAVFALIAGSILWLFEHPAVLFAAAVCIGGLIYWLARFSAARNRV